MKATISCASFQRYNANSRGNNSKDCVKRAISFAFNLDYNEVSKLLIAQAKKLHKDKWNILSVYEPVIYDLGGAKGQVPPTAYTVEEFIDNVFPSGTVIIETGPKPAKYGYGNHLTCVVDGTLYDSWDSSSQYVCQYYVVEGVVHEMSDIRDHLDELLQEGGLLIWDLFDKYVEKYTLTGSLESPIVSEIDEYKISYRLTYADMYLPKPGKLSFEIACPFSPTTTVDSARKKMQDIIKTRMYDRFAAVANKLKNRQEALTLFINSGYDATQMKEVTLYDGNDRRFYNSLPEWCKPFVVYVDVTAPGEYADSYKLHMYPIPGDPRKPKGKITPADEVRLEGFDAAEIKAQLDRYKRTYDRPYDDYER